MRRNLDVKSRLGEITRRSAELSAVSSKLANLALQLDQLRKLSGRADRLLVARNRMASRKYNHYPIFSFDTDDRDTT